MPGVEGLNRAREMLIAGASMEEVEAAFEEEMGALWMRGQMYDMYGHIFLDPINYLMPYLAPIGKSALASRINKVTRVANLSDDMIAAATDALRVAEKTGNMADVHKYTEILKGQEGLTTFEKISDFMAGGRELLPDEALKAPTDAGWLRRTAADVELAGRKGAKIPFTNRRLPSAPHTLTPASRGVELATMTVDSYDAHIFQLGQNIFEKAEGVQRFADGAISGQHAKYFLTPEGRLVQGFTKGIAAASEFRLDQYTRLLGKGIINELDVMAKTLSTTVDDIATQLVHSKGIDELAETFGRSADELAEMGRQLKGSPWSEELWQLALSNDIKDIVEHASIAMYGIHQRGKPQAWAGALKSAETLAWLKMNPSFPIKNFFTDEMIMFMEGVTGKMSIKNIDEYWKAMGFDVLPQRVKQGIGMAGLEGGEGAARGVGEIAEVSLGKPGWLAKFSKKINDINLGPLDMANYAQKIESRHSAQAFTVYYQKAMKQYWKAGVGFDPIDGVVSYRTLELMEAAEPGLARKFNNWASSTEGKKGLDDFLDANYNISIDEILEEARVALGYDVDLKQALPDEYLINLKVGLPKAAAEGEGGIRKYLGKFKRDLQEHLDDLALDLETRTAARAATMTKFEGPQAWVKLFTGTIDDLQGFHAAQAMEAAKIEDLLRGADKAAAGRFWAKRLPDVEQTYARGWGRTGSILKGIRKGTDGKLPKRVVDIFDGRVTGWKKFYKVRNDDYKTFFAALDKNQVPPVPWDTLKAKHSMMYLETIEAEAKGLDEMFEIVARQLESPEQQQLFRNMSGKLREGYLADKQSVITLQDELIAAPNSTEKQRLIAEWWRARYSSETHTFEQAGKAAMQGNKEAAQVFARAGAEYDDVRAAASKYADMSFTDADHGKVEKFINEFATPEEKKVLDAIQDNIEELQSLDTFGGAARNAAKKELSNLTDEINKVVDRLEAAPLGKAAEGLDDVAFNQQLGKQLELPDELIVDELASGSFDKISLSIDDAQTELGKTQKLFDDYENSKGAFEGLDLTAREELLGETDLIALKVSQWIKEDGGRKQELIALVKSNPEEAQRIQDTTRLLLNELYGDTMTVYNGKVTLYRSMKGPRPLGLGARKGEEFLERPGILPWDSMTRNESFAKKWPGAEGVWEFEVPVDHIFVSDETYGMLKTLPNQEEVILNNRGLLGGKLASVDGKPPTPKQIQQAMGRYDDLARPATTAAEAGAAAGKTKTYMPDMNQFWPEEPPIALAQDQYWFNRGFLYIDAIEEAAIAQAAKKPLKIANVLPEEAIDEITSWVGQTQAKYGDINNAAVRMGEYGRDAALLNYSRRYNYNTWLGTVAPYEFWMTQSMMKWGLHSIDHPAMLSTYWRYQKMLETVGAPNQQIPSRLKDHFKIELPFFEENSWMGNSIWVNPTRLMLPFEQYSYPFKEWQQRIRTKEGRAEYLINEWAKR
jgi:hypothetical protein